MNVKKKTIEKVKGKIKVGLNKDNSKKELIKILVIRFCLLNNICILCDHHEPCTHKDNLLPHSIPSFFSQLKLLPLTLHIMYYYYRHQNIIPF